MTVQPMNPVGKNPFGILSPAKAKGKTEGNPADPGFASLLAMIATPPLQTPGLPLPTGEAESAPVGVTGAPAAAVGQPMTPGVPVAGVPLPELATTPGGQVPQESFSEVLEAAQPAQAETFEALPLPETPGMEVTLVGIQQGAPAALQPAPATAQEQPAAAAPAEAAPTAEGEGPQPVAAAPLDSPPPTVEAEQGASGESGDRSNQSEPEHIEPEVPQAAGEHQKFDAVPSDRLPVGLSRQPDAAPPASTAEVSAPSLTTGGISELSGRYEPGGVMDAISRSLATTQDGDYTVTLQLHPERLGEVKLQLHLSGREVQAVMEVANPEARQVLQAHTQQLRQNLDQVGLTLAGFEVSTGQHQQRQTPQERREAFPDPGSTRPAVQGVTGSATAIERIRNASRRGGRLDTMA